MGLLSSFVTIDRIVLETSATGFASESRTLIESRFLFWSKETWYRFCKDQYHDEETAIPVSNKIENKIRQANRAYLWKQAIKEEEYGY